MFGMTSDPRHLRRWLDGARSVRPRPPRRPEPRRPERYAAGGSEPSVDDLLSDPVTGAIMDYDHVSPMTVRALIEQMRSRLLDRTAN